MAIERVGSRRLYDSIGCGLSARPELFIQFTLGSHVEAWIYMGPKPRFGIQTGTSDKYIAPESIALMGNITYHADATESNYPRKFFTEVAALTEIEVPDSVSEAFRRGENDAAQELLQFAAAREGELKAILDFIAGIVGLRFHRQFVLELINENLVAIREPNPTIQFAGQSLELLEGISLNENGVAQIEKTFSSLKEAEINVIENAGGILGWLRRAWQERDMVNKFVSLFIPLECAPQGYGKGIPAESKQRAQAIRKLIRSHAGEQRKELLEYFNSLCERQRPSLEFRFADMAEKANIPGWQSDVAAFSRFNRIRNALLHRGDPSVRLHISVSEDEVRTLEDIVERYVSYAIFGDGVVYKSRWRPDR
jgi:hypothetical protein